MRARFKDGGNGKLAVEFSAETDDEKLLIRIWDQQMRPTSLLRVSGWGYPHGDLETMTAYVVTVDEPKKEPVPE